MLAIVRLALRRPYTFIVAAILIVLFGGLAAIRTPTDIFPDIRIPVIAAVWTYRGLSPDDMAGRVVYYYERQLSTAVNDIDHIESQSLAGIGIVIDVFHQALPDGLRDAAMYLAFQEQRIDGAADLVDGVVAQDLDGAGLGIDLDLADVTTIGIGRRAAAIGAGLEQPVFHAGRQAARHERGLGDIDQADRFVGAADGERAFLESEIGLGRFQHMRGDFLAVLHHLVRGQHHGAAAQRQAAEFPQQTVRVIRAPGRKTTAQPGTCSFAKRGDRVVDVRADRAWPTDDVHGRAQRRHPQGFRLHRGVEPAAGGQQQRPADLRRERRARERVGKVVGARQHHRVRALAGEVLILGRRDRRRYPVSARNPQEVGRRRSCRSCRSSSERNRGDEHGGAKRKGESRFRHADLTSIRRRPIGH